MVGSRGPWCLPTSYSSDLHCSNTGIHFCLKELLKVFFVKSETFIKWEHYYKAFFPQWSSLCTVSWTLHPFFPEGGSATGPPCHRYCLWQRWCPDTVPHWWWYCLVLGRWRLWQAWQRRQWWLQSANEGISCLCKLDLQLLSLPCASQEYSVHFRKYSGIKSEWRAQDIWIP